MTIGSRPRTITSVGTTGSGGTGVNVDPPLTFAHAQNTILRDQVATPINVSANAFVHSCNRNFRTDTLVAWTDHVSATERATYDNTFYVVRRPGRERHVAGIRRDEVHRRAGRYRHRA